MTILQSSYPDLGGDPSAREYIEAIPERWEPISEGQNGDDLIVVATDGAGNFIALHFEECSELDDIFLDVTDLCADPSPVAIEK